MAEEMVTISKGIFFFGDGSGRGEDRKNIHNATIKGTYVISWEKPWQRNFPKRNAVGMNIGSDHKWTGEEVL